MLNAHVKRVVKKHLQYYNFSGIKKGSTIGCTIELEQITKRSLLSLELFIFPVLDGGFLVAFLLSGTNRVQSFCCCAVANDQTQTKHFSGSLHADLQGN